MRYDGSYRHLLHQLAVTQYKLKDQSSFFGFLWTFLHPALMLGVLYLFFQHRLGGEIEHYAIYLLLGLVVYNHFASSTSLAMQSLRATRELTTDAAFPKELLVFSTLLASSLEFFVSLAICLLVAFASGVPVSAALVWLPAIIGAELLLVAWVGTLLATVYPFVWDVDHIYQVFLRVLFFVTPIFYAASFLGDGAARRVLEVNPLAYVMAAVRGAVIDGRGPDPRVLGAFLILNAILFLVTVRLFRRWEPKVAEYV